MFNFIRLEIKKVRKSKVFWMLLLFSFVISFGFVVDNFTLGGMLVTNSFFHSIMFNFLIPTIFSIAYFGEDFFNKTFFFAITFGTSRWKILASKCIVFVLASNLLLFIPLVVLVSISSKKYGWINYDSASHLPEWVNISSASFSNTLFLGICIATSLFCFAVLGAVIFQNLYGPMIFLGGIVVITMCLINKIKIETLQTFPLNIIPTFQVCNIFFENQMRLIIISNVIYSLVLLGCSFFIYEKKDTN